MRPPVNIEVNLLDGQFDGNLLIALGFLFVVSKSGRIWVLNPKTLKEYQGTDIIQLPLDNAKTSPVIAKYMAKLNDGSDICRNYLFIASDDEILRVSIGYKSKEKPIVLSKPQKWNLDGKCLTNPIYLKNNIIVGTDLGLIAYNIDGEKVWKYNLPNEKIATQLYDDGDKIFFGTRLGNRICIHAVNTSNGKSAWDESYKVSSSEIREIHIEIQSRRLIFFDDDGKLHNLDIHGDIHYIPQTNKISDRPIATGLSNEQVFVITAMGNIHCLDFFGGMARPHFAIGGQLFFHSHSAIGADFIVFAGYDGTLLFVRTSNISNRNIEVYMVTEISVQGEIISTPIISDGCLYMLSEYGSLIKICKNSNH
jgi:outer membrane protein assembly factor BamB